ncbi:MAG TPA: glycosyltransferase family 1 protein [Candidatus Eisenbergiella merdigallinarum]|uniref:Glycosyltransferase family 1 protein n=1 Tax=Candidatus Eisenbergiella merdigallinarum TaxID=2838552 RepID=A0A9D2MQK9_9FIRM|nr:glycosyltransferase family 1 protein [Candidatus Eisenbergiella merdigallinarum]
MEREIRVLQVLGGTNLGGAESRVMDLYRNLDRSRIQFDFAVHGQQEGYFDGEIRSLGGRIYRLPKFVGTNWIAYQKAWRDFFSAHPGYACAHGHMTSTASIYLPEAKRAGVPLTIAHARSAGVDAGPKGWLTRQLRRPLWKRADLCLAASREAGLAVFGEKAVKAGRVTVVPNAIRAQAYDYRPAVREEMRRELGLSDAFVVGHVGRFHPCKNHPFLLETFAALCGLRPDARLILLGEGGGMEAPRARAQEPDLAGKVLFLGNRGDVWNYYQAMDLFLFPSLYEGLPGTVLEAQTSGLPCLVSDSITKEVKITDLVEFFPLKETAEEWAKKALKMAQEAGSGERSSRLEQVRKSGFDAAVQAQRMAGLYETGVWK